MNLEIYKNLRNMRSNYIVIEGIEGAGKTTACKVVADTLKLLGVNKIMLTREPGGTKIAEQFRTIILNLKSLNDEVISNKTEMLIFYAARIQLVETVIKPMLSIGTWVIGDRHDLSTQAYQGGGRGIDSRVLNMLRKMLLGDFRPALTIYLDVTPEIGLMRINNYSKLDRIEQESLMFFQRTRDRYLKLASQDKTILTIDATKPLKIVTENIRKTITNWFKEITIK